jgi:hypothetical protein
MLPPSAGFYITTDDITLRIRPTTQVTISLFASECSTLVIFHFPAALLDQTSTHDSSINGDMMPLGAAILGHYFILFVSHHQPLLLS